MIKQNIKQFKKRTAFRKQVRDKYTIIDNRLKYKYFIGNNNYKFLNIPFFNEEKYIIANIHNKSHSGINKTKELVIEDGYYWDGYSDDIKNYIKSCPVCNPQHKRKKLKCL